MAIVQCKHNHYYDDQRELSCPYCAKISANPVSEDGIAEQMTSYFATPFEDDDVQLTEAYGDNVDEYEKTIGIFTYETQNELTAGWLVCMNGYMKGKSYPIHIGRNFAGRSLEMDIVLTDDARISRTNHFSIVYDPKSVTYFLVAGTGQIYLNGKAVVDTCELKESDEVQAGESKYMFIPFCKEGRVWD